jgi:hypothetical protein
VCDDIKRLEILELQLREGTSLKTDGEQK